ncbi:MAG: hypothetical protein ACI3XN_02900 [Eubacteriales bacterium]
MQNAIVYLSVFLLHEELFTVQEDASEAKKPKDRVPRTEERRPMLFCAKNPASSLPKPWKNAYSGAVFCTNLFFSYYTPQILSCQALQENLKSRAFPKSLLFGFGQANPPKSLEKEGILWYNIMRRPRNSREGCSIDGRVDSETDFPLSADCRNRQASFQSNEPERCGGYV